jgi:hypothetical protein
MFLLDLITPNRRSPGWQFILFSVLFLTFLGLTLEYYVEMKLGYVLGITLGSLVILATIYGILVRNRGDLLEQIVEKEIRDNSNEYLVLEHKLGQYSKILDNPSLGNYTGAVKEMGKIRSRMNELDSQGRLYFGGLEMDYARQGLKKEKDGYVDNLVRERDNAVQRIREVGDVVGDVEQERNLAISRELLRKINKELNSEENLYDRVGVAEAESSKMEGEIQRITAEIDKAGDSEDTRELKRRREELQSLKKKITDFSKSGRSSVETLESGEAYKYAGRRLKDVRKVTTGEGKEYERRRRDLKDDEREIKRIVSQSSSKDFDALESEVTEVLSLYRDERDNQRLLDDLRKRSLGGREKRQDFLNRYQDSDVFRVMSAKQKSDFLDGSIDKKKLVDAAEKLRSYKRDLRKEKTAFFSKSEEDRMRYMEIKASQGVLERRFGELETGYQDQIDALSAQIGSVSAETPVVEREVDQRIADLSEKLGKLERNDLGDLSSLPEISAISRVEKEVEDWKRLDNFRERAQTSIAGISGETANKIDTELNRVLETIASETEKIQTGGGPVGNFNAVRDAIAAAVSKNRAELDTSGTGPDMGKDTIQGLAAGGAGGAEDVIRNTVEALKEIRNDGGASQENRDQARRDLFQIVRAARETRALSTKSEIKDKLRRLDDSIKDSGRDAEAKLKGLAEESQREGFANLKNEINRARTEIGYATGDKNPLELKRVLNSLDGISGQVGTQTQERKIQVTGRLKSAGDNVSDPKLQYSAVTQPADVNAITRDKEAFINQQKADLKAKLRLQKKILEKSKGTDIEVRPQEIARRDQRELLPGGDSYARETQDLLLLDPTTFTTPAPVPNVGSIKLSQGELQDVFQGYGQTNDITNSGKSVLDLQGLNSGNQNYRRLIDEVIASTQQSARDAIEKIQKKKILESQKSVLERTKKRIEEAPNELEKQRLDVQKTFLGVREAGPAPVISF